MHSERMMFLSRPVLARALKCDRSRFQRDVVAPLGREAAATTASSYIFTRHKRIADAIVSVLEREFGEDVVGLFSQLASAAIDAANAGEYVPPNLATWRYGVTEHFEKTNRISIAFEVAHAVLAREPDNPMTLNYLSRMYREVGEPERAREFFRTRPIDRPNRAYYNEWATVEAACEHDAEAAYLSAFSLSDQCRAAQVKRTDLVALPTLARAFSRLDDAYRDEAFGDAAAAAVTIARALDFFESQTYPPTAVDDTENVASLNSVMRLVVRGVTAAEASNPDPAMDSALPPAHDLTFAGLALLAGGGTAKQQSTASRSRRGR